MFITLSHTNEKAWLMNETDLNHYTASYRFQFSNFRYYFTLFSKFFSSFPHGTCSLSVSRQYLALDGIYHQIRAAFPSNPTLWKHHVKQLDYDRRGSHPLWRPFPEDFDSGRNRGRFYRLQFSKGRFSRWAMAGSLAATRAIVVTFFSSAYWYA